MRRVPKQRKRGFKLPATQGQDQTLKARRVAAFALRIGGEAYVSASEDAEPTTMMCDAPCVNDSEDFPAGALAKGLVFDAVLAVCRRLKDLVEVFFAKVVAAVNSQSLRGLESMADEIELIGSSGQAVLLGLLKRESGKATHDVWKDRGCSQSLGPRVCSDFAPCQASLSRIGPSRTQPVF